MNVLLCCSVGMSSSILQREIRIVVQKRKLDYKLAAISVAQIKEYIDMADIVLVAPQSVAEYEMIRTLGDLCGTSVLLIGREEYGKMNGEMIVELLEQQKTGMGAEEVNQFSSVLERKLIPLMNKVSNQRHLCAVRDGLIATIPLTIIGAIFLLIPYLPWPQSYVSFMGNHPELVSKLLIPFYMSLGLLSVYVSFGIGMNLAKSYDMDGLSGAVTSLLTFFTTLSMTTGESGVAISTAYLGGEGMFTAILTAILAVEVMRFCKVRNITIKMPKQVPANVGNSFGSLIPVFISVGIIWAVVHLIGFDINVAISKAITPVLGMSANSIAAPLVYVILTAIMWFFGMHPAVLLSIMMPIWLVNAEANMAAAAAGSAIPNIGVQPFIFTFLWIGGGGGTLALCLLMCFSKSKVLKSLGRLSIIPGIFNINEPIIFGLPIVLNPILIIPFTLGPIICTIVTYLAFWTGIVPGMAYPSAAIWTLPSVFAAAVATTSIKAAVLVIVNFIIYAAVYYPFFKIYEKKMVLQEMEESGKG